MILGFYFEDIYCNTCHKNGVEYEERNKENFNREGVESELTKLIKEDPSKFFRILTPKIGMSPANYMMRIKNAMKDILFDDRCSYKALSNSDEHELDWRISALEYMRELCDIEFQRI